ncbi:translation initiation factor IF-2 [bacterium]|nr:translation initiation factor IF-2 [bacterium]
MKPTRIPIVTILGHVDHGKTTLLDYIRGANVVDSEAGGITQRVSVFTVDVKDGHKVTFIDTPGHEAFDLMRSRGGSIADIVLLIVAADDGVMPQTEESIEIIKNSNAKPIVVINKVDLPGIDIEKIKRDVTNKGIFVEGMGGQVPVVQISAKTGQNVDMLLETISLVAQVEGLIERPDLPNGLVGKAFVLESVKDKNKGKVSTVIMTHGELSRGMWLGYVSKGKTYSEKVKGLISENDENLELLAEGMGGKILGLSELMELGSEIFVTTEKKERKIEAVIAQENLENIEESNAVDLAALFGQAVKEEEKTLKVVVKASSEGSLEALRKTLSKVDEDGYKVEIVQDGLGDITQKDLEMAEVTKSIILGFEVKIEKGVADLAIKKRILIKTYDLVYKLVEEISDAIVALSSPQESEEEIGSATVKAIFTLSNGTTVIGCQVASGVVKKGGKAYIVRGDDIIGEGKIESLRHEKETINEAKKGVECGVIVSNKIEAIVGDTLYCYKVIK